jgi:hypothetical protein
MGIFSLLLLSVQKTEAQVGFIVKPINPNGLPRNILIYDCLAPLTLNYCFRFTVPPVQLNMTYRTVGNPLTNLAVRVNTTGYMIANTKTCTSYLNGWCYYQASPTVVAVVVIVPTPPPTVEPTTLPTSTIPTSRPTTHPSFLPTAKPSTKPSAQPTAKPTTPPTSIQASLSTTLVSNTLGLSVRNPASHPSLTGNARTFTITNHGPVAAYNVSLFATASAANPEILVNHLPYNTCGTMPIGGQCAITVVPNNITTALPYQLNPTPITLTIQGQNTNLLSSHIFVIEIGSVYQDSFVYAIDDTQGCHTTACVGSVGGSGVTLVDQAAPLTSGNPSTTGVAFSSVDLAIPGISTLSSACCRANPSFADFKASWLTHYTNFTHLNASSFQSCNGFIDGQCNTANIHTVYAALQQTVPNTQFAASLCSTLSINGRTGYYLPAQCELAYDANFCLPGKPAISGLTDLIGRLDSTKTTTSCQAATNQTECLSGFYLSSTRYASNAKVVSVIFDQEMSRYGFFSGANPTTDRLGVRCARALTP